MYGPKETAVMIMKGKKSSDDMYGGGMEEMDSEMEEMEMEYSEEQHEMAEELMGAVKSGNTQSILESIHGIYMSYS
jgi:hypothetical protein